MDLPHPSSERPILRHNHDFGFTTTTIKREEETESYNKFGDIDGEKLPKPDRRAGGEKRAGSHLAAALVGRRAHALALAHLNTRLGVVGRRGAHALLDLAGHGQKGLLDIIGALCRRF